VAVERRQHRKPVGVDRVDRGGERMATSFSASSANTPSRRSPMSYPAEKMLPSPVMITHRASSSGIFEVMASSSG